MKLECQVTAVTTDNTGNYLNVTLREPRGQIGGKVLLLLPEQDLQVPNTQAARDAYRVGRRVVLSVRPK